MKKILLLALFSIIGLTAFSQKISRDEKDAFTGMHVVETNYVKICNGFTCALRSVDNGRYFLTGFNCGDEIYTIEKGADFMFKLEDNSVIKLSNIETSIAKYFSETIGSVHLSHFYLECQCLLGDDQLKKMQTTKITMIRFYTTDGYIERNVSDKSAKKLLKLFNLM